MIKILIVDDDEIACKHLKKYFTHTLGHQAFAVSDPARVLPLIEKEAPHVVLLDVFMPGINGLDLLRQIKDKYGDTVKVIMITIAGGRDQARAEELGADDFIRKPFDRNYLRDTVMEKIQEALGYKRRENVAAADIPRILVVDDEIETLDEIKYFLTRVIECGVDTAPDAAAALDLIEKKDYDLMFLDIKMPGASGFDLMRQAKEIKSLPDTVIITGYSDADIAEQCEEEGAVAYIPKPIYLENFKRTIKNILTQKGKYIEKGSTR